MASKRKATEEKKADAPKKQKTDLLADHMVLLKSRLESGKFFSPALKMAECKGCGDDNGIFGLNENQRGCREYATYCYGCLERMTLAGVDAFPCSRCRGWHDNKDYTDLPARHKHYTFYHPDGKTPHSTLVLNISTFGEFKRMAYAHFKLSEADYDLTNIQEPQFRTPDMALVDADEASMIEMFDGGVYYFYKRT